MARNKKHRHPGEGVDVPTTESLQEQVAGDVAAALLDMVLPVKPEADPAPAPQGPVLGDRLVIFRAPDLPALHCPLASVNGLRDRLAVEYPGACWLVEVIQYRLRGPRPDWEADGQALELILRHWERGRRMRRLPEGRVVFSLRPHD